MARANSTLHASVVKRMNLRYAIGFYARGLWREPNSQLYKVVYDRASHEKACKDLAQATLKFYLEGMNSERQKEPEKWAEEFFLAWDEWIYKLAPLPNGKRKPSSASPMNK